jgi:hypothetical protein
MKLLPLSFSIYRQITGSYETAKRTTELLREIVRFEDMFLIEWNKSLFSNVKYVA